MGRSLLVWGNPLLSPSEIYRHIVMVVYSSRITFLGQFELYLVSILMGPLILLDIAHSTKMLL